MSNHTETTLITGASSGIGFHLAHEFALQGHPLVLTAPDDDELQQVASELRAAHGVNVRTIAGDLMDAETPLRIYRELEDDGTFVSILVNNAGHGFRGRFWELDIETDLSMVRLNIEAVLRMTKMFLPPMLARGQGRLLITASVAGFEPGPLLAVYHASKAFVLSWAEALCVELEDFPISVTALCPGPTDTDFFPKADMVSTRAFQKASVMAPQDVAKAGYKGLMSGDMLVVPGAMNKALVMSRRFLSEGAQAKMNERMYEEVPESEADRTPGEIEANACQK